MEQVNLDAYSLETELTCDEAKKLFIDGKYFDDFARMVEIEAKVKSCTLAQYNQQRPDDPAVVTMTIDMKEDNPKILFNTIRLKEAEKVADISKLLITVGANAEFSGEPATVSIVSAMGNYSVDAYMEAAVKNDPLIIFVLGSPLNVVTKKLGKDLIKTILEGKLDNKIEIIAMDGLEYIKENPTIWLGGTTRAMIEGMKKIESLKSVVITIDKVENKVSEVVEDGAKVIFKAAEKVGETIIIKPGGSAIRKIRKWLGL